MTTLEILTAARALVARGWCQGSFRIGNSVCPLGAIQFCCENYTEGYVRARQVFGDCVGTRRIGDWNDAPGRTQAEVVAAFTAAIELARKEQTK